MRDESCHDDEGGRLVLLAAVLLVHDVELGVGAGTEVGWVRKGPTILCDRAGRPTTEISDAPPANLSEEYAQKRRTAAVGLLALRGGSVKREKLLSWWWFKQHAKFCTLHIMYTLLEGCGLMHISPELLHVRFFVSSDLLHDSKYLCFKVGHT